MNKGIAFAGNLIVDNIKYISQYPAPHKLTTITGFGRSTGGLVCNCALTAARLDPSLPVKTVGIVGDDEEGRYILDCLSAYPSIDTGGIRTMGSTSYTDVMTQMPGGGRTFFQYRGANALLSPAHFDFDHLHVDLLHIGYILLLDALDGPDPDYPTAMCRVLAEARARGIATSVDVVSEDGQRFASLVPPALAYSDYCIINELEAERTTGIPIRDAGDRILKANLPHVCMKLMAMGVGRWVVIHMPELSCGLDREGPYVEEPSWHIPDGFKKSSVGAGDAFATGILYGAYQGWSLAEALRTAGAIAAYSLSGEGAADSILPLQELMRKMYEFQPEEKI